MKIKGKRSKTVLLLVFVMIFALVGCSSEDGKSTDGEKKPGDAKIIQITYWKSLGTKWLDAVIEGFERENPEYKVEVEAVSGITDSISKLGIEDVDQTDLYLHVKNYDDRNCLVALNDVLDSKAAGETVTIREKFDENYLALETAKDGNVYNLTYGGGVVGIFYNKEVFAEQGIKQMPRTTKELIAVCDTLYAADIPAFAAGVGNWEDHMAQSFFVQYDGLDYVMNHFYGCTDDEGNSPSLSVFTKKDGRYEAFKVLASVLTPEYTDPEKGAAMRVTGTWFVSDRYELMRTPVVSSIVDKLTTITNDGQLRKVITAIDNVTDGKTEISAYKQGENYVVDGIVISAADWEYVGAARNTMSTNFTGHSAFIPEYSDNIQGAKEFLRYLYSDKGYSIYASTLQQQLPLSLSEGKLNKADWTEQAKQKAHIFETTEQVVSIHNASAHDIFTVGGATWKSDIRAYSDKFYIDNSASRWTAEDAWEHLVEYAETHYQSAWVANIDKE
jgi:ABC-type glycerol-3-phosphate transport system substrate-binding protein